MTKASRNKRDVGHTAVSPHHVGSSPGSDQRPLRPLAFLDHPACIQSADSEKCQQSFLLHVTPSTMIPASISCHSNRCWSRAAIKVTVPRPESCLPGLRGGQGLGRPSLLTAVSAWCSPQTNPEGRSPRSAKSRFPHEGPRCPPSRPTHTSQAPSSWRQSWQGAGAAPLPAGWAGSQGAGREVQEGTHSSQTLGGLTSEDSRWPQQRLCEWPGPTMGASSEHACWDTQRLVVMLLSRGVRAHCPGGSQSRAGSLRG